MTVQFLIGDVREKLREIPADSVDCVVTSPPYWGLRDYGVEGQIGLEPTLGEHLDVMVEVFDLVRRAMKPTGTLWLNYGDVYATKPNGRKAEDTKAGGTDDRTFRDKPFSTAGAIYAPNYGKTPRGHFTGSEVGDSGFGPHRLDHGGRVVGAGPVLKPKDLCMVPNRLAIALQEVGWWVRSEIIWAKPNPMPDSSGRWRPSTAHEKIFLLSKSGDCFYDAKAVAQPVSGTAKPRRAMPKATGWDTSTGEAHGSIHRAGGERGWKQHGPNSRMNVDRVPDSRKRPPGTAPHAGLQDARDKARARERRADVVGLDRGARAYMADVATDFTETRHLRNYEGPPVWKIGSRPFRDAHFATFPPELAERCILAGCPEGGLVLDPFGGAGTTSLVAERLGRDSILIELSPTYARMARRRIVRDANKRSAA